MNYGGDTWYVSRIYEELKNYTCVWLIRGLIRKVHCTHPPPPTHTPRVPPNTQYWASMVCSFSPIFITFQIMIWLVLKMCKLMAKIGCIFVKSFVNSPSWWRQNGWHHDGRCHKEWCHDSSHFPLAPACHVTRRIKLHRKNMTPVFMNEMEHFGPSDRFEF